MSYRCCYDSQDALVGSTAAAAALVDGLNTVLVIDDTKDPQDEVNILINNKLLAMPANLPQCLGWNKFFTIDLCSISGGNF